MSLHYHKEAIYVGNYMFRHTRSTALLPFDYLIVVLTSCDNPDVTDPPPKQIEAGKTIVRVFYVDYGLHLVRNYKETANVLYSVQVFLFRN